MVSATTQPHTNSAVADFYNNRHIFITGGTGFVGKVLTEKLLRSCSGITKIYLLIRPKKELSVKERLIKFLREPIFDQIKHPSLLNKIVPIEGDVTETNLGLSSIDEAILINNVSIVFHSAATVRFNETLKESVNVNVTGTRRVIELCRKIVRLQAIIHVSTAYCHCENDVIHENIYLAQWDYETLINLVNRSQDDVLEKRTEIIIQKKPNTYTFTKALCESLLADVKDLPIIIIRPTIVMSTLKEPVPGWIDNWNGPTGLIGAAYKGFLRTMYCKENIIADFIPVDMVVNLMIVAASRSYQKIKVFNICTGTRNPITWGEFADITLFYVKRYPLENIVWYPTGCFYNNRFVHQFLTIILHYIPACVADAFAVLSKRKPVMLKLYGKLKKKMVSSYDFFIRREWIFKDENVRILYNSLGAEDKDIFQFDVESIKWRPYLEFYVLGIRSFLFKQAVASLPSSRKQQKRMYLIHCCLQLIGLTLIYRVVFRQNVGIQQICFHVVDIIVRVYRMIPYM